MDSFTLHIPTLIFFGGDQLPAFSAATRQLGQHAFVVTGTRWNTG